MVLNSDHRIQELDQIILLKDNTFMRRVFLFINGLLDKVIGNSYYKASNDTVTSK